MPTLSFIITTHKRPDDAMECIDSILAQAYDDLEVVVVTSPAGDATGRLTEYATDPRVTVVEEPSRRGPAAAGNVAFESASGEIIVSVDDDVVFPDSDAAGRIVEEFEADSGLGILAFRIVDYDTGRTHDHEIPVGRNGQEPERGQPTTYCIGAGAAFRAEAVDATAGYPERFHYHMQELDLSFQILDQGYEAVYEPAIVVRHKRSTPGRPDDLLRWRLSLENRLRVAIRHLPVRYIVSSIVVWSMFVLYRTRGSLPTVLTAYRNLLADRDVLLSQRDVIGPETRRHVRERGGRLWY